MANYQIPQTVTSPTHNPGEALLIASGDSRLWANQICWPAQANMERQIVATLATSLSRARIIHSRKREKWFGTCPLGGTFSKTC